MIRHGERSPTFSDVTHLQFSAFRRHSFPYDKASLPQTCRSGNPEQALRQSTGASGDSVDCTCVAGVDDWLAVVEWSSLDSPSMVDRTMVVECSSVNAGVVVSGTLSVAE